MSRITDQDVLNYIADCAESIIEDDFNEDGDWDDEDFGELQRRAFEWISAHRAA